MSWDPEIEELRRREALARAMGGPENVAREHKAGRLTARERIERLLDRARSTRRARWWAPCRTRTAGSQRAGV